jgi:hypothetical protein
VAERSEALEGLRRFAHRHPEALGALFVRRASKGVPPSLEGHAPSLEGGRPLLIGD